MINRDNLYPILFACNLLVKGSKRAILCDVQRQVYQFVPMSAYDMLTQNENKSLSEIKFAYNNEYDGVIDEFLEELVNQEWLFFTDTPQYFPKMALAWEEPTVLTNAIIDINNDTNLDFEQVFIQLSNLGCEHIQIRCFANKTLEEFQNILDVIGTKRIISVEFVVRFQQDWSNTNLLIDFCQRNPRIASLNVYAAPINQFVHVSSERMGYILFSKENITNASHCGQISTDFFVVNIKTFTEAQQHNTCLNRKISIDTEGYIRNCPSMLEHYGNIKNTTLQEALQHPDFKKYWFVNKDQISVCKDCEFRYICTDCRAYRENQDDLYSKPLKCGYNPYTCEWEAWSTNPLKQKAIEYYGM